MTRPVRQRRRPRAVRESRIEVYRARNGEWGVRVIASNGAKVLTAGETFRGSRSHALRAIRRALESAAAAVQGDRIVVRP